MARTPDSERRKRVSSSSEPAEAKSGDASEGHGEDQVQSRSDGVSPDVKQEPEEELRIPASTGSTSTAESEQAPPAAATPPPPKGPPPPLPPLPKGPPPSRNSRRVLPVNVAASADSGGGAASSSDNLNRPAQSESETAAGSQSQDTKEEHSEGRGDIREWTMEIERSTGGLLGMQIHIHSLSIDTVADTGVVADFNKANPDLSVRPGDKILMVNGKTILEEVIAECKEAKVLVFKLQRRTYAQVVHSSEAPPDSIPPKSEGIAVPRLDGNLKTFVINLARRTDRRASVEGLCKELGVDYEIVQAVDGQALRALPDTRVEVVEPQERGPRMRVRRAAAAATPASSSTARPQGWANLRIRRYCTHWVEDGRERQQLLKMAQHRLATSELTAYGHELWGAVGCSLSHQHVLQRILDEGLEWALVLEDDATLAMPAEQVQELFNTEMQRIGQERENWSLIYLGGHVSTKHRMRDVRRNGRLEYCTKKRDSQNVLEVSEVYQTHAYLIRRSIVSEILRLLQQGYAADAAFVSWSRVNAARSEQTNCFLFDPPLLVQPGGADRWKDSDIFIEGAFFKKLATDGDEEYTFEGRVKRRRPKQPTIARGSAEEAEVKVEAVSANSESSNSERAKKKARHWPDIKARSKPPPPTPPTPPPPAAESASEARPAESSDSAPPDAECSPPGSPAVLSQDSWDDLKEKAVRSVMELFKEESVPLLGVPKHAQNVVLTYLLNSEESARNTDEMAKLYRVLQFIEEAAEFACSASKKYLKRLASEITPNRVLHAVKAMQGEEGLVRNLSYQERCRLALLVRFLLQHVCNRPSGQAKEVETALSLTRDLRTAVHRSSCTGAIVDLHACMQLDGRSADSGGRAARTTSRERGKSVFAFPEADLYLSISGELEAKEKLLQKCRESLSMLQSLSPPTTHSDESAGQCEASANGSGPSASQQQPSSPSASSGAVPASSSGTKSVSAAQGAQAERTQSDANVDKVKEVKFELRPRNPDEWFSVYMKEVVGPRWAAAQKENAGWEPAAVEVNGEMVSKQNLHPRMGELAKACTGISVTLSLKQQPPKAAASQGSRAAAGAAGAATPKMQGSRAAAGAAGAAAPKMPASTAAREDSARARTAATARTSTATARAAATSARSQAAGGACAPGTPRAKSAAAKAPTPQRGPGRPPKASPPIGAAAPSTQQPPPEASSPQTGAAASYGPPPKAPGGMASASGWAGQAGTQQRGTKRPAPGSASGGGRTARYRQLRKELCSLSNGNLRKKARYLGVPPPALDGAERHDVMDRIISIEMSK